MGFFNFIETFFFISLAITFVLILLLVYHFKQRLSHLEHKSETVVQIINNIVKEINNMRSYFMVSDQLASKPLNNVSYSIQENNYGTYSNQYKDFDDQHDDDLKANNDDDDDDEDENNDDDEDENNDDDEDENNDDDEDENNDDDEDENNEDDEDENNDDDEDENNDDDEDENNDDDADIKPNTLLEEINEVIMDEENLTKEIKVINVGTTLEGENEIHAEDINSDDFIEPLEIEEQDESVEIQEENDIHVEKINTIDLETETLENSNEISKESSREVYQKMTVQSLKTLVISKGLCSDSSKMKKPELLKLLESSEDV